MHLFIFYIIFYLHLIKLLHFCIYFQTFYSVFILSLYQLPNLLSFSVCDFYLFSKLYFYVFVTNICFWLHISLSLQLFIYHTLPYILHLLPVFDVMKTLNTHFPNSNAENAGSLIQPHRLLSLKSRFVIYWQQRNSRRMSTLWRRTFLRVLHSL